MTNAIREFKGEYAFLSNFHPVPNFTWQGLEFPTVEHAFQAAKCSWNPLGYLMQVPGVEEIRIAPTPTAAKRLGRAGPMVPNWDAIKLGIMHELLSLKFSPYRPGRLYERLRDTGNAWLTEGNRWNDTFWGQDIETGRGSNWLGTLLMLVRSEWILQNVEAQGGVLH